MSGKRPLVAALGVCLLGAGCAVEEGGTGAGAAGTPLEPPSAALVDGASFTPATPPPPTSGPVTELAAAVDLSETGGGQYVYPIFAVPTDDGAYVAVADRAGDGETWVVTVGPGDGGLEVTGTVEIPAFLAAEGIDAMQVLDDGTVLAAGHFGLPEDIAVGPDYGFVVVDPVSGETRTEVVLGHEDSSGAQGDSTIAPDGRTVYTVTRDYGSGIEGLLVATDVASGDRVAEHDTTADPGLAAYAELAYWGIAPRPDGGLRLLLLAGASNEMTVPMVATYGPDLQPVGDPVQLLPEAGDSRIALVPGTTDGTVFAIVEQEGVVSIVAVAEGATTATTMIRSSSVDWLSDVTIDPGQTWLTVPLAWGAGSIDVTTGEIAEPVDTGCRSYQGVRWLFPGADGDALMLGECTTDGDSREMLWIAGT